MFIRKKTFQKKLLDAHELGLRRGYELGWQMRRVERNNRGLTVASKLDQELEQILEEGGKQE